MGNCFTTNHSDRSTKNVNKPTHVGNDLNFSTLLANEAVKIEGDEVAQPEFSNEVKQKIDKFFKDCEEIEDWINTQLFVASSEDYGKDLDDVDRLIHNFDTFQSDLTTHEDKLTTFNTFANELITEVQDQGRNHDGVIARRGIFPIIHGRKNLGNHSHGIR